MGEMDTKKISLLSLVGLVVGSMIGSGIFSMPQNMAASAAPMPLLIGWGITGIGIIMLAMVFQRLSMRKHDLKSIVAYAQDGFGDYVAFNVSWGYGISALLGNVSYVILVFSSFGVLFPNVGFGEGNTALSLILESVALWALHYMITKGIKEASFMNAVITIAKVVPIVVFLWFVIVNFDMAKFTVDLWGDNSPELSTMSTLDQIKGIMLVTVWAFIGVEGASIFGARAKRKEDVGIATIVGIVIVLLLLALVSILPFGILSQSELANLQNPSAAGVLSSIIGSSGNTMITIGVIIAVSGALLSWTLLPTEVFYNSAIDTIMPKLFAKENKVHTPTNSLFFGNLIVQIFLVISFFSEAGYVAVFLLATSMILIPYLSSSLYLLYIAVKGDGYEASEKRGGDITIGVLSSIYGVWLIYASGLKYLLLSSLLYLIGLFFHIWTRKEAGKKIFEHKYEIVLAVVFLILAIYSLIGIANGTLTIE